MKYQLKFGFKNVADNLMFIGETHRMNGGMFPKTHPFIDCPKPFTFAHDPCPESNDRLSQFRRAGYFASCFPEGDGVTIRRGLEQSNDQLIEDICRILQIEINVIKEA